MAKPNYQFQKRQKELEKKKKSEEKLLKKQEKLTDPDSTDADESGSAEENQQ
jgi:hypothetical protein